MAAPSIVENAMTPDGGFKGDAGFSAGSPPKSSG